MDEKNDALAPTAPAWWPPRSGDVGVFYNCVEGGLPYRVCVSYNHAERGWMNVATGGVLPRQPYPGDLDILVRDGERYPSPDRPCHNHYDGCCICAGDACNDVPTDQLVAHAAS